LEGAADGDTDGFIVVSVGLFVLTVGVLVGLAVLGETVVPFVEGFAVGSSVVGLDEGDRDGFLVGSLVGCAVVGAVVGDAVGLLVG
jgi:zinc transporter ZupT